MTLTVTPSAAAGTATTGGGQPVALGPGRPTSTSRPRPGARPAAACACSWSGSRTRSSTSGCALPGVGRPPLRPRQRDRHLRGRPVGPVRPGGCRATARRRPVADLPVHGAEFARVIAAIRDAGVQGHITIGGHYPSFDPVEVLDPHPRPRFGGHVRRRAHVRRAAHCLELGRTRRPGVHRVPADDDERHRRQPAPFVGRGPGCAAVPERPNRLRGADCPPPPCSAAADARGTAASAASGPSTRRRAVRCDGCGSRGGGGRDAPPASRSGRRRVPVPGRRLHGHRTTRTGMGGRCGGSDRAQRAGRPGVAQDRLSLRRGPRAHHEDARIRRSDPRLPRRGVGGPDDAAAPEQAAQAGGPPCCRPRCSRSSGSRSTSVT